MNKTPFSSYLLPTHAFTYINVVWLLQCAPTNPEKQLQNPYVLPRGEINGDNMSGHVKNEKKATATWRTLV